MIPESVIENWKRQVYIICHAIDTSGTMMKQTHRKNELDYLHSFHNGIHLMASFCALALLAIKHDTMFYLQKLSASRR